MQELELRARKIALIDGLTDSQTFCAKGALDRTRRAIVEEDIVQSGAVEGQICLSNPIQVTNDALSPAVQVRTQ
jgi:hypothetical protein